jgi:hypothetical protein
MLTSYIKHRSEDLQTLQFVLYSIHSAIRYRNIRSVEHVERMESTKKHAAIIFVETREKTTLEGIKHEWNLPLHM